MTREGEHGREAADHAGAVSRSEIEPLEAGRDAITRRAWRDAFDLLTQAEASGLLEPHDLEALGEAAWWTGRLEDCIDARQRAYSAYVESGNSSRAAKVALTVAKDYYAIRASVGTSWLNRADRLLFDAAYAGTPPWDIGRPQSAFLRLAESGALRGRVLDVGCGTGEHALMAAALGLEATGIDASRSAIALAGRKAEDRGLAARFMVWDAFDLPALGVQFDTVLDSGLFHVFDNEDRARYIRSLRAAVVPDGRYFLLCFSDQVPGDVGPRRVSEDEIRESFSDGWEVLSIEGTTMDANFTPTGIPAWLSAIVRTAPAEGG